MDPTTNLQEQREIVARRDNTSDVLADFARLCELVQALDEWLSKGGFAPNDWQ